MPPVDAETRAGPIRCRVELFGTARLVAGRAHVPIELRGAGSVRQVVIQLAETCPGLVGKAIRDDGQGVVEGYVLNLNGVSFVDCLEQPVESGDSVLLLSNQAGG